MRVANVLLLAAAATAAPTTAVDRPDHTFLLSKVMAGYAKSCKQDSMTYDITPQAFTWQFTDMNMKLNWPPGPNGDLGFDSVAFCVMLMETAELTSNWRFAVDSVTFTGKGSLSGGAKFSSFDTYLSINVAHMLRRDPTRRWYLNSAWLGTWDISKQLNSRDTQGDFSITVPSNSSAPTNWSPCGDPFIVSEFQFSQQTRAFLTVDSGSTAPQAEFDPNLKVAYNLKWEKCNPAGYKDYGSVTEKETDWDAKMHGVPDDEVVAHKANFR